jgi:hypothetical protein
MTRTPSSQVGERSTYLLLPNHHIVPSETHRLSVSQIYGNFLGTFFSALFFPPKKSAQKVLSLTERYEYDEHFLGTLFPMLLSPVLILPVILSHVKTQNLGSRHIDHQHPTQSTSKHILNHSASPTPHPRVPTLCTSAPHHPAKRYQPSQILPEISTLLAQHAQHIAGLWRLVLMLVESFLNYK